MKKISIFFLVAMLSFCISAPFAIGGAEDVVLERDGSSMEKAIVIKYTGDYFQSIGQEYEIIEKQFGVRGEQWEMSLQMMRREGDRSYDVIEIKLLPSGEETAVYFDITDLIKNSPFKS